MRLLGPYRRSAYGVTLVTVIGLVAVVVSAGGGNFVPHPTTPSFFAGNAAADLQLGDLDGDGDLDAVFANAGGAAETVRLNDGAGNFSAHPTTPSFGAGNSFSVALGDLDGDGDLDAVVANAAFPPQETVWVNNGLGSFTAHPTTPSFGAGNSQAVRLGDLDGDLDLDAVVVNIGDAETVWCNDGAGNFTAHPTTPSFLGGASNQDVVLGDLDGDADLDAIVANGSNEAETVWLNNGQGSFSAHPITPTFGSGDSYAAALGDFDADGDLDAVVVNLSLQPGTVWINDGAGSFSPHPSVPSFGAGNSSDVTLGDLDGDGDLDAVVAPSLPQPVTVWANDGTGGFTPHPATPAFGIAEESTVALGDLDGDADLDVVVANSRFFGVTVWLNEGDTDGITDSEDNCPAVNNADQSDADGDGIGDVCDACPADAANDADGDGACGDVDNCPAVPNASQSDLDLDGAGDSCDVCPADAANDADSDGVCGNVDNCPATANPGQSDIDNDGIGDACDAPATIAQCTNNGWMTFSVPRVFKNQGDCIKFVNAGK